MAEKEKELKDPCHIGICRVENGWKIDASYESEQTLGAKAGWYPSGPPECKNYVEKSKDAVVKRIKELL